MIMIAFPQVASTVVLLVLQSSLCLGLRVSAAGSTRSLKDDDFTPSGLQSGPAGSSFPGGALYHTATNTLSITGATYTDASVSNCFFATVQLPSSNTSPEIKWIGQQTFNSETTQACTSLSAIEDKVFLAGYAETNRSSDSAVAGLLFDANNATPTNSSTLPFVEGNIFGVSATRPVIYPVAVTAYREGSLETFFAVSRDPIDTAPNNEYDTEPLHAINPTRFYPYGSTGFKISVHRFQRQYNATSIQIQTLRFTYSTTAFNATVSIFASGIAKLGGDLLIVVGSTAGQGKPFGTKCVYGTGTDLDGFVAKFDATSDTGSLYGSEQDATRIESINQRDDRITGLCHNTEDDPDHIYLVGTTAGQLLDEANVDDTASSNEDTDAYLIKMNVDTLKRVWTTQLGAFGPGSVTGAACTVTPDSEEVWFGGVVHDGAVLADSGTSESYGGNDVFVAKVNAEDGLIEYVRQMGTEADDGMARRGGGLTTDLDGNAVVTGFTFGSWYRMRLPEERATVSDLFVATVSRADGRYALPVTTTPVVASVLDDTPTKSPLETTAAPIAMKEPTSGPVGVRTTAAPISTNEPTEDPTGAPTLGPSSAATTAAPTSTKEQTEDHTGAPTLGPSFVATTAAPTSTKEQTEDPDITDSPTNAPTPVTTTTKEQLGGMGTPSPVAATPVPATTTSPTTTFRASALDSASRSYRATGGVSSVVFGLLAIFFSFSEIVIL